MRNNGIKNLKMELLKLKNELNLTYRNKDGKSTEWNYTTTKWPNYI